jgi:FemAB-related protein (PEP-CTERM system-associated)
MKYSELAEADGRTPVKVQNLTAESRPAWDRFVQLSPAATFFHLSGWEEVLRRAFGHRSHYLYAESNGEIVGVLPLAEVKSVLFGHALVSTPFCVYGGVVASQSEGFAALEQAAANLARELGVDHLEMRNRQSQHTGWVAKDLYYTFERAIDPDPEKNLLAIPRKQRAMVRKAIQRGLQARRDDSVDDLYRMYSESVRNLGTPVFGRRYLEILREVFPQDSEILTVTHEDRPVAGVLSFRFRDQIMPYYGGGSAAARSLAANDFMYWAVMDRAREQGVRIFDFGRSKMGTGAFDFKRNWGFEPRRLHYEYLLVKATEMPNLSPTNAKYRLMIDSWSKLPLSVANTLGPPLAKYLG